MGGVTFEAPAKLNLSLAVGPRNADGYHPIRSLMVTVDGLVDRVTVTPAAKRRVVCADVEDRDNLAWLALDRLESHTGKTLNCRVDIDKAIPDRAGLGGGSSDAAATLRAANVVFELGLSQETLEGIAGRVASDVAFFVRGGAQWAEGRGERLTPASAPPFVGVVVVPRFGLSTPKVYAAFDRLGGHGTPVDGPLPTVDSLDDILGNDLWAASCAMDPNVAELAGRLRDVGATATLLCGSGSGVVGFFPDRHDAESAADRLRDQGAQDRVIAVVWGPGTMRG